MRKLIFPILIGLGGVVVLLWLGFWQLDRLEWKEEILARIDARMGDDPIPLPPTDTLSEAEDEYLQVLVSGKPTGEEIHVLTSGTAAGTGYRVIAVFETFEGRNILLDRGLLPIAAKDAPPITEQTDVQGTLIWPDEVTRATAGPDLPNNIWFARDVPTMARTLGTDPILVVEHGSSVPDPRLTQLPVNSSGIKNDHLQYAITWFLLAMVWAAMTLYWLRRSTTTAAQED